MNNAVQKLIEIGRNLGIEVLDLADVVLDDEKFGIWSGSAMSFVHHYGKGQLAQHTLEVVELAMRNNEYFKTLGKGVDDRLVYLAAVFHDAGKMFDYAPKEECDLATWETTISYDNWESTDHKLKIYHISRSGLIWSKAFDKLGSFLPPEAHDQVLHAILAHHGQKEWGSPVTPKTRLAWLIHLADNTSARMDDCEKKRPDPWQKK